MNAWLNATKSQKYTIIGLVVFIIAIIYVGLLGGFNPTSTMSDTTPNTIILTNTIPTEPEAVVVETESTESLTEMLYNWDIENLTDEQKNQLSVIVGLMGGIISYENDSIVIVSQGITSTYYFDKTYIMFDSDGNASGTRWIDCELSARIPKIADITLSTCVVEPNRFAVQYNDATEDVFITYNEELQMMGYIDNLTTDTLFTCTDKDGYNISVTLDESILTVFVEAPPEE